MKYPISLLLTVFLCSTIHATNIEAKADLILSNPELESYHGWIKYLEFRTQDAVARLGIENEETKDWIHQQEEWVTRILDDPDTLGTISGTQEWAYLSKVDDSGQPFRLATPLDYDPEKSYGLQIYIHGYSGNHIEHSGELESIEDNFRLSVLGRARGGFYMNLSENDVMEVIQFMLDHWNIDPQRLHFSGGSMGGWASFYLTNRYPHLVASSRPTCGFAPDLPVANWLHVPFYAIHSVDDPVVPVVQSRVPLKTLMAMGGEVVIDETDGLGHASWDYSEGNERSNAWYGDYKAPEFKDVRKIDYTATDGKARQGYWATIETWGKEHRPARVQLNVSATNDLYVNFHNVKTLSIDVANSPIDSSKDLQVILNASYPVKMSAPIADKLYFTQEDSGELHVNTADPWKNKENASKHYPGGASNLYNGDPLLVIWGTGGSPEQNAAMEHAAAAAMRSPHPWWTADDGETGSDGVVHEHMTYSRLKGKPDTEVTEEDLIDHHLVIIGSSKLNAVAERLSADLPIAILDKKVVSSDGVSWQAENPLVFLTYYNPHQRDRLIYWVSAESPSFFNDGSGITTVINSPSGGIDFALLEEKNHSIIATRTMASDWDWSEGYDKSEVLPDSLLSKHAWYAFMGDAYVEATGADVALVNWSEMLPDALFTQGETRFQDLEPFLYQTQLVVFELNKAEMWTLKKLFSHLEHRRGDVRWLSADDTTSKSAIEDEHVKIVATLDCWWAIAAAGKFAPESLQYANISVLDAYRSFLNRN